MNFKCNKVKRLLFLGGFPQMIDIVNKANDLNIFTVVVDKEETSPAKAYADKSYNVSTDDVEKLAVICENEEIDGVFTGFEDFNIHVACKLCKIMGFPFYATSEQLEIVTNKEKFKSECKRVGLNSISQYSCESAIIANNFPYIVKPIDSYGSRGITVCNSENELLIAIEDAKKSSKTNNIIIEDYIDSEFGTEFFYTIVNGNIHLTATADRYTNLFNNLCVPLPVAEVFPSQYSERCLTSINLKFTKLIKNLKIENGVVLFQTITKDNKFYPYEMAFRLTGEQHYLLVKEQKNIDLGSMMINLSLGNDISFYDSELVDLDKFVYPSCNLAILLNPGKIVSIDGLEVLDKFKEIKSYIVVHKNGDIISNSSDYSRILLRVNIVAASNMRLKLIIDSISNSITVKSEQGKDLVASKFNFVF